MPVPLQMAGEATVPPMTAAAPPADALQQFGAKAGAVATQAGQAAIDAARQAGQTAVDATNQWGAVAGTALDKLGLNTGTAGAAATGTPSCGDTVAGTWIKLWSGALLQAGSDAVAAAGTCAQSAGAALKSLLPFLN